MGAVFAFLILALLGGLGVLWSARLFQRYHQSFNLSYTLHLGFWTTLALVQITQYILAGRFLPQSTWNSLSRAAWPLTILLLGISLLFFVEATVRICGRALPRFFVFAYLSSWAGVIAVGVIFFRSAPSGPPGLPVIMTFLLKNCTILTCFLLILVTARRSQDRMLGSFQCRFGWLFLAGYLLWQLAIAGIIPLPQFLDANYLIAGIQIGFHFPLLALISRFLERQAINRPPSVDPNHLDDRLASFGVTTREVEIIGLVMRGCSNREIENELFISLETVKKHIFNIYRKLGVKNRVQLSNFIQNRFPGPTGPDGRRAE